MFTHSEPHANRPDWQRHAPAAQSVPEGQALPQLPQFAASLAANTQELPHWSCSGWQVTPLPPVPDAPPDVVRAGFVGLVLLLQPAAAATAPTNPNRAQLRSPSFRTKNRFERTVMTLIPVPLGRPTRPDPTVWLSHHGPSSS